MTIRESRHDSHKIFTSLSRHVMNVISIHVMRRVLWILKNILKETDKSGYEQS